MKGSLLDRFLNHIDMHGSTACWLWKGSTNNKGYGQLWMNGKLHQAHRVAYGLFVQPIPDGLFVLHQCDVPSCVNPAHLWLGTQSDNMRDSVRKQRYAWATHPERFGRLCGEQSRFAKLTEGTVREIRRAIVAGTKHVILSKRHNVTPTLIGMIAKNKIWKHVS